MKYTVKGSFVDDEYAINTPTLTALVHMIITGTNIKSQTENNNDVSSAVLSITQVNVFN